MNDLRVTFDDKRDLYWVNGLGFDFALYFTSGGAWLECDSVARKGEAFDCFISIPSKGVPTADWVHAAVCRELAKYWDLRVKARGML